MKASSRVLRPRHAVLAASIMLAAACAGDAEPGGSDVARNYAAELNVDLGRMEQLPGGLRIRDIEMGAGDPAERGQVIVVHYTGWLPDGTEFDTSRNHGVPMEVVIGDGRVIPGWDDGIPGMRPGGRRQLVIPPDMAYGADGIGPIPPNATLVFVVELIEVHPVGSMPPGQ